MYIPMMFPLYIYISIYIIIYTQLYIYTRVYTVYMLGVPSTSWFTKPMKILGIGAIIQLSRYGQFQFMG